MLLQRTEMSYSFSVIFYIPCLTNTWCNLLRKMLSYLGDPVTTNFSQYASLALLLKKSGTWTFLFFPFLLCHIKSISDGFGEIVNTDSLLFKHWTSTFFLFPCLPLPFLTLPSFPSLFPFLCLPFPSFLSPVIQFYIGFFCPSLMSWEACWTYSLVYNSVYKQMEDTVLYWWRDVFNKVKTITNKVKVILAWISCVFRCETLPIARIGRLS